MSYMLRSFTVLSWYVEHALTRLRRLDEEYLQRGYRPLVLFSGGKDSLAVLHLCYRYFSSDMEVCYIEVTGNTHEYCTQYVVETVEKLLGSSRRLRILKRRDVDFAKLFITWGPPYLYRNRWCMRIFKTELLNTLSRKYILISGEKTVDSYVRLNFMLGKTDDGLVLPWWLDDRYRIFNSHIGLKLIWDWTDHIVEIYITRHSLPRNRLYDTIGHSGNCMYCPSRFVASIRRMVQYMEKLRIHYPHWYSKLIDMFEKALQVHRRRVGCTRQSCIDCPQRQKYRGIWHIATLLEVLRHCVDRDIRQYLAAKS